MEFTVEKLRRGMAVSRLPERRQAYLEGQPASVLPYLPAFAERASGSWSMLTAQWMRR